MKSSSVLLLALLGLAGSAAADAAPKYLGPNKCSSCHDHDKQKAWADKDTHTKALAQLEDKKAAGYAKAIGLADPYSLKGSCVSCHATVFNGDANAGVSCETCHGPGSDYNEPHQQKGSYAKSITLGMFDTRGNLEVWGKMCVGCHIMTDKKLIAAGHKSGADFDVGVSSAKIVHWAPTYDFGKLTQIGKAAAAKMGGGAAPAPAKPAAAPTARPTSAAPPPTAAPAARPTAVPARPTAESAAPAAPAAPQRATPSSARPAAPPPTEAPAAISASPIPTRPVPAREEKRPVTPEGKPKPTAPPTPADKEISIQVRATAVPTLTPTPVSVLRPSAPETVSAPAPSAAGKPRVPARRPAAKRPRPRATASAPGAPTPTLTPTRRPAPQEPPRRAPH